MEPRRVGGAKEDGWSQGRWVEPRWWMEVEGGWSQGWVELRRVGGSRGWLEPRRDVADIH